MAVLLANACQDVRALGVDQLSDKQLVLRFAGTADEAAFAVLVARHGPLVLNVCRRVLGAGPDLQDVFQATFVVLARVAAGIRKQTAVASWLYGVAYRLALQLKTRRARCRRRESTDGPRAEFQTLHFDPAARAGMPALGTILDDELLQLPPSSRDALVLCYLERLSDADAARHLDWALGTLQGRLQKARDLLRQRLLRRGVTLSAMGVVIALSDQGSAELPTALFTSTVRFALQEPAPVSVAQLAEKAAQSLAVNKVKRVALAASAVG